MRSPHIYIDLDDVLSTFTPALFNKLGLACEPHDYACLASLVGETIREFNFAKQAQAVWPERNYTYESFWLSVSSEMWASMPKSDDCDWLLDVCATLVGKDNVTVLTAPVTGAPEMQCRIGKYGWRDKFLPAWTHANFCIRGNKGKFAHGAALLIDDGQHNIDQFRSHGGAGLVWPRPWNNAPQLNLKDIHERITNWCEHAYANCSELYVA